jgi:hypothetical protein
VKVLCHCDEDENFVLGIATDCLMVYLTCRYQLRKDGGKGLPLTYRDFKRAASEKRYLNLLINTKSFLLCMLSERKTSLRIETQ